MQSTILYNIIIKLLQRCQVLHLFLYTFLSLCTHTKASLLYFLPFIVLNYIIKGFSLPLTNLFLYSLSYIYFSK